MGKLNGSLFSSKDQTWETPQDLFDKLDSVFNFNLDVCAVPETAKCARYFTPETDGLSQRWKGTCWMNPPYGKEQIRWITKAYGEANFHSATVVCLIPARPDTQVWQDYILPYAKAICFIRGRLKFSGCKSPAPFPSALIIFGDAITEEQGECLREFGGVIKVVW